MCVPHLVGDYSNTCVCLVMPSNITSPRKLLPAYLALGSFYRVGN